MPSLEWMDHTIEKQRFIDALYELYQSGLRTRSQILALVSDDPDSSPYAISRYTADLILRKEVDR